MTEPEQQSRPGHPSVSGEPEAAGSRADRLSAVLQGLARELHPEWAARIRVQRDSDLERDIGIDSLARTQLLLRLEDAFQVQLSEDALINARTVADLITALDSAVPGKAKEPSWTSAATPMSADEPEDAETLIDALAFQREKHGDRTHVHLIGSKGDVWTLTYEELWQGAQEIATGLAELDLPHGSAVAIMLPTGEDFLQVFLGVLLAGAVPVPIYPPVRRTEIENHLRRQAGILGNAQTPVLITTPEASLFGRLIRAQVVSIREVVTVAALRRTVTAEFRPQLRGDDLALLQYTSGSTGDPKGVMLTHANLLANIRALGERMEVTPNDVIVSWLPLYHDMGLIGTWLGSLYYAAAFVVMAPMTFLARPQRWLWAIDRFGGTLSAAPNFAYEFALTKVPDDAIEGLDLSSWRMAGNGAERVSAHTIERFATRYAAYGFRRESMTPMYGLAECSVAVTTCIPGQPNRIDHVNREQLVNWGKAVPAADSSVPQTEVVSCGVPLPGHEVRVVDSSGRELGDRQEGRIQFRGPSATQGYLHAPEKTAELFQGDWLDSGDRGYVVEGELYVTGRIKDIVIRAGTNLYPDEIEEAVGNLDRIRKGQVAVFASEDPSTGSERLIVLAETRIRDAKKRDELQDRVFRLVTDLTGLPPDEVVLAPPGAVVKTPNGKVRRAACRQLFETGRLNKPPSALWLQIVGLLQASVGPQLRRWWRSTAAFLYAVRFQLIYRSLAPFVFAGVLLMPALSSRRCALSYGGRLMLRLADIPVRVEGIEELPRERPLLLIANHSSYLDSLILAAALPFDFAFVAKRELIESPISSAFLKRLGAVFVERFDPKGGVESAGDVTAALDSGQNVLIFPEGTFDRRPGLRAFHMGAFVSACQSGTPIVPIGLSGTRGILRGESIFARHGSVRLAVGAPIAPGGDDWQAALELRNASRNALLRLCDEPDLVYERTKI